MLFEILECDVVSPVTGRIYPRREVEQAVAEYLKRDSRLGYLGAPSNANYLDLTKVSHKVDDMFVSATGVLFADVTIMGTPCGELVMSLLDKKVDLYLKPAFMAVVVDNNVATDILISHTYFSKE